MGIAALIRCHYRLQRIRPDTHIHRVLRISDFPIALGMHLRSRRESLGFNPTQVARNLGVRVCTYRAWEDDQTAPAITNMPAIVEYLGYCPFDSELPFRDKLVLWRSVNGLTQRDFSGLMGLDQSTLARWERGDGRPHAILRSRLFATRAILADHGLKLWTELSKTRLAVGKQVESDASRRKREARSIPTLRVGHIEIDPSHNLFVEYDGRWPIHRRLEAWRTSLNLSQRDFAKLVGFGPKTIWRWEKGQRLPPEDHVVRIRSVLARMLDGLNNRA